MFSSFISKDYPWSIQQQTENSILQDLDLNQIEKYFLILNAIEQNLSEYMNMRHNLNRMLSISQDLTNKHMKMNETLNKIFNDEQNRLQLENLIRSDITDISNKGMLNDKDMI